MLKLYFYDFNNVFSWMYMYVCVYIQWWRINLLFRILLLLFYYCFRVIFPLSTYQIMMLLIPPQNIICPTATAAKSLQLCPTLCVPIDGSPPGSPVPGILLARTLEWVAISFSNAWKWKVKVKSLSHVWLLVTPWTAAFQAPPSMGFSRLKYRSGVPLLSPYLSKKSD